MTPDKLSTINALSARLNKAQATLNAIKVKTTPTRTQKVAVLALANQKDGVEELAHHLELQFVEPTQDKLKVGLPKEIAARFLADIERYYQGEVDALRAEFERV